MQLLYSNVLYLTLFIGTLLLVEGTYFLIRDWREGDEKIVNRRLRLIASKGDRLSVLHRLRRDEQDILSKAIGRILPALERLVRHSGMTVPLVRIVYFMAGLIGVLFVLLRFISAWPIPLAAGVAALVGVGLPLLFLIRRRSQRLKRFREQLPDALSLMVRSLRAGHPIPTALGLVAQEMGDPAGTEFGIATDEMNYGLNLHEALQNITERVPFDELKFVVVSINIQHEVGGNLAEVLTNIEEVIRDRFLMFAKIRAVSAEGRMSGVVIGLMPVIVSGLIALFNPTYFAEVTADPLFTTLMVVAAVLLAFGHFSIWRLVNFKF